MSEERKFSEEADNSTPEPAAYLLFTALKDVLRSREQADAANRELAAKTGRFHEAYGNYQSELEASYVGRRRVSGPVRRVVRDKDGSWYLKEEQIEGLELEVTGVRLPRFNDLATDAADFMKKPVELNARLPGEPASPDDARVYRIVVVDGVKIEPVAE